MKTVLLAWELGAGTGHIMALRRYAARLRVHDTRVIAAVRSYAAAEGLLDLGVAILQAPPWPGAWFTAHQRKAASSATMGDTLAEAGLLNETAFLDLLRQWDELLTAVRPDLVVGDYAPAASLMARGRIPLILTGNGFTLPPSEMASFPVLHDLAPPRWNENDLLTAVDKMVRSVGAPPLDQLTQIFAADARIVESFPILDPYTTHRVEPVDGPALDSMPAPRRAGADRIVVYLARGVAIHPDIVDALRPFAPRVDIHAPELSDAQRSTLSGAGARLHHQPFALSDTLPHACLVIHLGGSGVASHALACGVPQLVIARHIEQELNGAALMRAGLGQIIRGYDPAARIPADVIAGMLGDATLARRAADAGVEHRGFLQNTARQNKSPLEKFERAALSLMGIRA